MVTDRWQHITAAAFNENTWRSTQGIREMVTRLQ